MTLAQLIACGIAPTQARAFLAPLTAAMTEFEIGTPVRQAAFVAQAGHESAGFTRLEENLYYTTPARIWAVFPSRVRSLDDAAALVRNPQRLANRVYAGRLGNGDEASGDGWRYRGRGLFQLTGKANYRDAADALGQIVLGIPDLVAQPVLAARTAAWYWRTHGLNKLADARAWDSVTRVINGPAMLGSRERRDATLAGLQALGVTA